MSTSKPPIKTHLLASDLPNSSACGSVPGWYEPLRVTADIGSVNCKRCLAQHKRVVRRSESATLTKANA